MRRAARIDDNQPEIVAALRKIGCSVALTHTAGSGFPDLVVGLRGHNFLLEVKDGEKSPSEQKLTIDQERFRSGWQGQYAVVTGPAQAIHYILKEVNYQ